MSFVHGRSQDLLVFCPQTCGTTIVYMTTYIESVPQKVHFERREAPEIQSQYLCPRTINAHISNFARRHSTAELQRIAHAGEWAAYSLFDTAHHPDSEVI
jgi:muconolactone delta-isomerase